jgi:malonyl-CoA O-methyltransferase
MFDSKAVKSHFSQAAAGYDSNARLQQSVMQNALSLALNVWPESGRIADIGSGTGLLAKTLNRSSPVFDIAQLDIAYGMCVTAQSHSSMVVNGDACHLPFPDNVFDGVFSSLMLQWLDRPEASFSEMARLLKSGHYAIISTFAEGTLKELKASFTKVDSHSHSSDFLSAEAWMQKARDAGFSLRQSEEKNIVEYYPDVKALMRAIKAIGASHKASSRKRGMMTPRQMKTLEAHYRAQYGNRQGLPLSWQLLYMVLRKD